eukprot:6249805-Prymnesium_polylepis.2
MDTLGNAPNQADSAHTGLTSTVSASTNALAAHRCLPRLCLCSLRSNPNARLPHCTACHRSAHPIQADGRCRSLSVLRPQFSDHRVTM